MHEALIGNNEFCGIIIVVVQKIIRFHGRVQGVGIRYTTHRTAAGYKISGYVRNMPDGSVECVAEGEEEEIDRFIVELSDRMSGYIHNKKTNTAPASHTWSEFSIRY